MRTEVTDCPLGSFQVIVRACSGSGDCAAVCIVHVFETDENGRCTVMNSELCFGCTACLEQCSDNGVVIIPNKASEHLTVEELLK